MTEQQPYRVVQRFDAFEVREYPPAAVAEVSVDGSFEQAGTRAFGSLFGYISGRNQRSQSIAMTAPVLQRTDAQGRQAVAFVLPAELSATDAPEPGDTSIRVHEVPGSTTAAMTYTGRWTEGSFQRHRAALLDAVKGAGLTPAGEPRFARYNPPFTPWFLRRNEVLVDLAELEPGSPLG